MSTRAVKLELVTIDDIYTIDFRTGKTYNRTTISKRAITSKTMFRSVGLIVLQAAIGGCCNRSKRGFDPLSGGAAPSPPVPNIKVKINTKARRQTNEI